MCREFIAMWDGFGFLQIGEDKNTEFLAPTNLFLLCPASFENDDEGRSHWRTWRCNDLWYRDGEAKLVNAKRRIAKLTPGQSNPHWWVGSDAPSDVSFIAQTASHVSESVATSEFLSANGVSARIFLPTRPRGFTKRYFIEQSRPKVDWRRLEKGMETIGSQSTELCKIVVFNDWGMPEIGLIANRVSALKKFRGHSKRHTSLYPSSKSSRIGSVRHSSSNRATSFLLEVID